MNRGWPIRPSAMGNPLAHWMLHVAEERLERKIRFADAIRADVTAWTINERARVERARALVDVNRWSDLDAREA